MAVKVVTERFSLSTAASGTQDFTTAKLGGETVKAVKIVVVNATANDTDTSDMRLCMGFTDGTREVVWSAAKEDGESGDKEEREFRSDAVINFRITGGSNPVRFSINSFITNGVRLDIDSQASGAYLAVITFFAGSDVSAYANYFTPPSTGTKAITGVGFEPDCLLVGGCDTNSAGNNSVQAFGYAVNGGNECCINRFMWSSFDTMQGGYYNNRFYAAAANGSFKYTLSMSSWDANGFTVQEHDGSGTGDTNDAICYLALNFNSKVGVWCGELASPTSTGDWSITSPGFTPQYMELGLTVKAGSSGTWYSNDNDSYGVAIYSADDTDEYSQIFCCENGGGDAAKTHSADSCKNENQTAGSTLYDGTLSSFDANGWTINFSTASGDADDWIGFAIESEEPAAKPQFYRTYRNRRNGV